MRVYSIMIWNAQHFDHQESALSSAYKDKKQFLDYYIAQRKPGILALFEAGKTGTINESLVSDLASTYSLIACLEQEGGKKKHTTLGSLVLVRKDIADQFDNVTDRYILSDSEQRAPLIIRHTKSTFGFAFYHANSSYKASANIVDTIGFINENADNLGIKSLLFFGGDMNVEGQAGASTIHGMNKLLPSGGGYTHSSSYNVTLEHAGNELRDLQERGNYLLYTPQQYLREEYMLAQGIEQCEIAPVLRLLDYAYVRHHEHWKAGCEGGVILDNNWYGKTIGMRRVCLGQPIRSDHFPVLFTLNATLG
jgi:hypothetical protein